MDAIFNRNTDDDDIREEMKRFVETKAGVKGLVDSGLVKLPRIFIQPPERLSKYSSDSNSLAVPVIDLKGLDNNHRQREIVDEICRAAETWGVFQLINHGVPTGIIDNALQGVKIFHEQPSKVKNADNDNRNFDFSTNARDIRSGAADWKDYLTFSCPDQKLEEENLPQICRETLSEYTKYMFQLKDTLSQLLSEALGLCPDYLSKIECMRSGLFVGNYYPACPEPDLTLGALDHSDPFFVTIIAQDNVGGLQVLHDNQWVDVPCVKGSLIVYLGDLMQIISNDKFKGAVHRVLAGHVTRASITFLFLPSSRKMEAQYGPLEEMISNNNPPMYPQVTASEYTNYFTDKIVNGEPTICNFKLRPHP